jgi:hypothetical protein
MSQFNEPWVLGEEHESMCRIESADGKIVAVANGGSGIYLPNTTDCAPHDIANRIVACVNACRGIPTNMLESVAKGEAEMGWRDPKLKDGSA